jgi:hypothetical protein
MPWLAGEEFLYALRRDRVWNIAILASTALASFAFLYALRRDRVWNPTLSGWAVTCDDADLLHGFLFQDRLKMIPQRSGACSGWSWACTGDGT